METRHHRSDALSSIGAAIGIGGAIRLGQLPLTIVHERATTIERKLKERFGEKTHVTLHMEPQS